MNSTEPNYRHFSMAKTAETFAFIAAITALFGTMILPFIFGGLAIIFAVLSKGNTKAYHLNARLAIIISCITLVGNTAFTAFAFYNVFFNEEYRQQLDETFEQIYGMSMEEYTSYMFSLPENTTIEP